MKLLRGNPGRRPLNNQEPTLPALNTETLDTPPVELMEATAIAEWTRLAPMLRQARHVTQAERGALIALCQQWARYLEANQHVAGAGMVIKAPSGYPMPNPYIGIANKALANCTRLWAELGLTPSSRSRVTASSSGASPDPQRERYFGVRHA
jgi:P27 family predicted phage terminase small subunit